MMKKYLVLWAAFGVFTCSGNKNIPDESYDACWTNDDCSSNSFWKICCGGDSRSIDRTKRMCYYYNCLNHYCATESDCSDPTLCCRSNLCVDRCSGCASNADCSAGRVCCKKSYPIEQTFCAETCVGESCHNNDDCAVSAHECCRNGKCINTFSCVKQCKSNMECDSGKYCCKKKSVWFWQDRCNYTCVGEDCSSDNDCGAPDEYCFYGKCATKDLPTQKTKAKSRDGLTPAPETKPKWRIHLEPVTETKANSKKSFPGWAIAIICIGIIVIAAFGASLAVFWYRKRRERSEETAVNSVPQHTSLITTTTGRNPLQQQQQQQQQQNTFFLDPSTSDHCTYDKSGNSAPREDHGHENPLYSPNKQLHDNVNVLSRTELLDGPEFESRPQNGFSVPRI